MVVSFVAMLIGVVLNYLGVATSERV
jgi:hypothetical protein